MTVGTIRRDYEHRPIERPDWLPPAVWPFETVTIAVSGSRVAVTDVGVGPTLLFAHAAQWSFLWRDVMLQLSDRFRCIAFDPPGFGLSDRVPTERQTLAAVRDTVGEIVDHLDLRGITLVMHDLGGVSALAAAAERPDRFEGLVAANTFGWRPSGVLFRPMLAVFGSVWMRELDAYTAFLSAATSWFGVGRHLDGRSRKAFRRGLDRPARRGMHRLFKSARKSPEIYEAVDVAVHERLQQLPLLTIFGSLGDYLVFQPKWRKRYPDCEQVEVPWGMHFPMSDNPTLVADSIAAWHDRAVGPKVGGASPTGG